MIWVLCLLTGTPIALTGMVADLMGKKSVTIPLVVTGILLIDCFLVGISFFAKGH